MKNTLVIIWLMCLLSAVVALFWYNELIYQLPTPLPANYKPVKEGTVVNLKAPFASNTSKPLFLHFFNPDCPCSRFNMAHFNAMVKQYGNRVNFAIVVMNNDKYTAKEIQKKFGLNLPVSFDTSIAKSCGVYSTPQAVLLDTARKLYYRGNYNSSRYCTNEKTSFARFAIEGLLNDRAKLVFSPLALRAYGCTLPNCNK